MSDHLHKEFPKSCDPKDFWGQVKRTVNGQPITQEQIDLIVDAICNGLIFNKADNLLDIGCGNGALSVLFFSKLNTLVGIDFSEYLISVAKENFEKRPNYTFHFGDAYEFIINYPGRDQITKALCYGVFSYFEQEKAEKTLSYLCKEYKNLTRVCIGNLPDKERVDKFFYKDIDYKILLHDPKSSIGIWRSKDEMRKLATNCGWKIEFQQMPENFYSAHYRYDVILSR